MCEIYYIHLKTGMWNSVSLHDMPMYKSATNIGFQISCQRVLLLMYCCSFLFFNVYCWSSVQFKTTSHFQFVCDMVLNLKLGWNEHIVLNPMENMCARSYVKFFWDRYFLYS